MAPDMMNMTNSIRRWVVFGLLLGLSLAVPMAQAAETVTYYYTNQQGTPLATADASGNVLSTSDYRPYGGQVLGSPATGPGYTGHVNDADSGLVYMQARYYDPTTAEFLSADPKELSPGEVMSFGRYSYANGNPISRNDPDGRAAQLLWTAPDKVTYTVPYIIGESGGARLNMTSAQINAAVNQNFSGTVSMNGINVTVTARAVEANGSNTTGKTNFINVVQDTQGVTRTGRAETNEIGGDRVTIASTGLYQATASSIAHELGGHVGGAGDQYKKGIDVNGNELQQDAPGASGVMYNLNGGANQQTMLEILKAPTNTNSCAPGVTAANGSC
jgi:RHS repeat-associated protein